MDEFMVALLIVGIALVLLLDYFLAKEFYKIAQMKGYFDKRYFWLCFVFGFIGYLMVIALPVIDSAKTAAQKAEDDSLPTL